MHDFLMDMTVLNERLSLASSLGEDKAVERETLADAILASVQWPARGAEKGGGQILSAASSRHRL